MNFIPNKVIGYRMDRQGTLYVREINRDERKATEEEIHKLLTQHPEIVLSLAWQG